jgi:hypothetical protein
LAAKVPIIANAKMTEGGKFRWDGDAPNPLWIEINPRGDHKELASVLEIGHLLDFQAIGAAGEFASKEDPLLSAGRKAVDNTGAVRRLEDLSSAGSIPFVMPDGRRIEAQVGDKAAYLLDPAELFSRTYAQFIAEESGERRLIEQVFGLSDRKIQAQWSRTFDRRMILKRLPRRSVSL